MSEHDAAPPPSRCKCLSARHCKCLEVQRCCFCISLLHGAYIIGTLQCFALLLTLFITIHVSHGAGELTVGLIFELICDVIFAASAALLLWGALRRRPTLVLIWIVSTMGFVLFTVINLTTLFFVQGFSMRFFSIIIAVLGIYFSICMYSFYRKLVKHELDNNNDYDFDNGEYRPDAV